MNSHSSYPNKALCTWQFDEGIQQPSLYYRFMRWASRTIFNMIWKARAFGRHNEPTTGGVVYISNHQSFFDPVLTTMGLQRPCNYMARDTLFKNPAFRKLISSLNAFPIKRGKADMGALKEAMRRLKDGKCIVIFPEGTRTHDGHIGEFLPGVAMLSQRAAEWTVPVVLDGAYEVWPRTSALPVMGAQCVVEYGKPIHRSEIRKLKPQEFVDKVRQDMIEIQTGLRKRLGRPELVYDTPSDDSANTGDN